MGSVKGGSKKEDGNRSPNMRRNGGAGETPREGFRATTNVGILGQIKNNRDASKRRMKLNSKVIVATSQITRKEQNSFKSFRRSSHSRSWFMCGICTLVIVAMLVAGVVIGVKYSAIGGWTLFTFTVALSIVGCVLLFYSKQRKMERLELERETKPATFYHTDISDFPFDPVLQRGITQLVFHGQPDCQLCALLREYERARDLGVLPHEEAEHCKVLAENSSNNEDNHISGRETNIDANNDKAECTASYELKKVDITINENDSLKPNTQILSRDSILTAKKQARIRNKKFEKGFPIEKKISYESRTNSTEESVSYCTTLSRDSFSTRKERQQARSEMGKRYSSANVV